MRNPLLPTQREPCFPWLTLSAMVFVGWILCVPAMALSPEEAWESDNQAGMRAFHQERYADAKQWFLEALNAVKSSQGSTQQPDPHQAITLNNLASVNEALGEYEEAELHYRQSLTMVEAIQGSHHPDLVPGLNNLALLYAKQGQLPQAESLWRRGLQILEGVLGTGHPHLIPLLMTLAHVTQSEGKVDQAELFYTKALKIAEKTLPSQHPRTAAILREFASFLRSIHRTEEASSLEDRAEAIKAAPTSPERRK